MSAAEWRQATDVREVMQLAARRWLCWTCHNTGRMHWVGSEYRDCASCRGKPRSSVLTPRKQRLIACGACRFLGEELTGEPALRAVEVAERFADGLATPAELAVSHGKATAPAAAQATLRNSWAAATSAVEAALGRLAQLHRNDLYGQLHAELTQVLVNAEANYDRIGRSVAKAKRRVSERRFREHFGELLARARNEDARAMAEVPRDILGDPYDRVRLVPEWLEANCGLVRTMAQAIYDDGTFDDLPILADALQDAGCTDERLLDHCREPRHYRGCWLLDLLLCKR